MDPLKFGVDPLEFGVELRPKPMADLVFDLDEEQRAAFDAYLNNNEDPSTLLAFVDKVATADRMKTSYDRMVAVLGPHVDVRSTEGQLGVVITTIANCVESLGKQVPAEQKDNFGIQLVTAFTERMAAQAILGMPALANAPLRQIEAEIQKHILNAKLAMSDANFYNFRSLLGSLVFFKRVQKQLKGIDINPRKEARDVERLTLENDGLFEAIRSLQKYSVKDVYVREDSSLPIADWHIYDVEKFLQQQAARTHSPYKPVRPKTLARFSGFENRLLNKSTAVIEHGYDTEDDENTSSVKGVGMSYVGLVEGKPGQVQPDAQLDLHFDGNLYQLGGTSLRWFAEGLGLGIHLEIMRARILTLLADIVVPAYMIDDNEEIKGAEAAAKAAKRIRAGTFLDLVLARTRLIKGHENMDELVEQEEKKARRAPRHHSVGGFIKPIPKHHRASQKQRELCREKLHKELAEFGETYVDDFERGGKSDSETPLEDGHRARIRRVGGAVVATS